MGWTGGRERVLVVSLVLGVAVAGAAVVLVVVLLVAAESRSAVKNAATNGSE